MLEILDLSQATIPEMDRLETVNLHWEQHIGKSGYGNVTYAAGFAKKWHYPPQYRAGLEFNCSIPFFTLHWLKLLYT